MIVRSIVDLHKGTISMSSDGEGHGCSSTLEIPIIRKPVSSRNRDDIPIICSSGSDEKKEREKDVGKEEEEEEKKEEEDNYVPELLSPCFPTCQDPGSGLIPTVVTKVEFKELSIDLASMEIHMPSSHASDDSSSYNLPSKTNIKKQLYLLVVDDSALNRRMIIKLLGDHICDQAVDGVEAVAKYVERVNLSNSTQTGSDCDNVHLEEKSGCTSPTNSKVYDAILMDYMMPNMDGPTATEIIREMGYAGPVIGITGNLSRLKYIDTL